MDNSKSNASQPRELFGHSLFKKKSWLDDEFPFTPPDESGFLSMGIGYDRRRSKNKHLDPAVSQMKLSNENDRHGSSSSNSSGKDSGLHFTLGSSNINIGDRQQKAHHHPSVFSLSAPESSERRSSHDFSKRTGSQVLVEIPSKAETCVPNTTNTDIESPSILVAKFNKLLSKEQRGTSSPNTDQANSEQSPLRKISSSSLFNFIRPIIIETEVSDFHTLKSEVDTSSCGPSSLDQQAFPQQQELSNDIMMGQERNKLTSNHFFTNSMFTSAAHSAATDLVASGGTDVSHTDGNNREISVQNSISSNFSGAGADNFDVNQIKVPKKRPKPSTLREMNFWAPQSM